jgi:hypothetical protein
MFLVYDIFKVLGWNFLPCKIRYSQSHEHLGTWEEGLYPKYQNVASKFWITFVQTFHSGAVSRENSGSE